MSGGYLEYICPEKKIVFHFRVLLSGLFHSFWSLVKVYHEIGRWGTDPAPNPMWTWRKWHQPLPAVTYNLCSGLWNRTRIFLHLSLIGLKTRVSKCKDLGHGDKERRENTGWQPPPLKGNRVPHCLLLSWDTVQTSVIRRLSSVLAACWLESTNIHRYHQTHLGCVSLEIYSSLRTLSLLLERESEKQKKAS